MHLPITKTTRVAPQLDCAQDSLKRTRSARGASHETLQNTTIQAVRASCQRLATSDRSGHGAGTATQSMLPRVVPLFLRNLHELHFSVLTSMLTQVKSSGSQVCVGNRSHRAEPIPVLRRAPTLSDEQGQQRVGVRALSPSEHLPKCAKERPRKS